MKATGIVRQLDHLGRFVIPKELRRTFNINEGDSLEIYTDGDKIILGKYQSSCVICGNNENLAQINDKSVCEKCIAKIRKW